MPYIKVNDIQMYYEIHGDGEPLVLIVGLGTDISEWGGIIRNAHLRGWPFIYFHEGTSAVP